MGEFRKYRPYYALNALRFNGRPLGANTNTSSYAFYEGKTRVPNFKDISGVEYGWLKNHNSYSSRNSGTRTITVSGIASVSVDQRAWHGHMLYPFTVLTPFATTDKLSAYSVDDYDYQSTMVGQTYFQRSHYVAKDVNKILYSMSIFNDNVDSYVVNADPSFALNTFYELVDGSYILLESEPSNWVTNYMDYYKIDPAEDIKVSCIKFRNEMLADPSTDRSYGQAYSAETAYASLDYSNYTGIVPIYALLCAYFLDEEVTIHPGDSYLLSLSFESSQF